MTYRQFLTALRKTNRTWRLNEDGVLRCGCHCPVTKVAINAGADPSLVFGRNDHVAAARYLGLRHATSLRIVFNSDNDTGLKIADKATRRQLLRACGVAS